MFRLRRDLSHLLGKFIYRFSEWRQMVNKFGEMKTKTMRVVISDHHFAQGVQGSPSECPLALALKDLGYEDVSVSWVCSCVAGETWSHDQRTEAALQSYDGTGILWPRSVVLVWHKSLQEVEK